MESLTVWVVWDSVKYTLNSMACSLIANQVLKQIYVVDPLKQFTASLKQ